MKNIKKLKQKIKLRDLMIDFISSSDKIDFEDALKLNNEISFMSMNIDIMKRFNFSKLQDHADDYKIELISKLNYNAQKDN